MDTTADKFQTPQYAPRIRLEKHRAEHKQKHTIILAHGLLGFDELRLAGHFLPGLHYWRGITEALSRNGIEVIVAAVPPSGSIEARAAKLAESISQKAKGKQVNIIAYVKLHRCDS
jgi:alpha-beta hydrolase superfamily lysophospholipase